VIVSTSYSWWIPYAIGEQMAKRRKSSPQDNIITLKLNLVNYCGSGKSSWEFPGSKKSQEPV
jgi:hypothetical protein